MEQECSLFKVKNFKHVAYTASSQEQVASYLGLGLFSLMSYMISLNVLELSGYIHKIEITTTHLSELHKVFSFFEGSNMCF